MSPGPDRRYLGYTTAPSTVKVDGWRVRLFGEAIGEPVVDPCSPAEAAAAGRSAQPVPPTFLKALESEHVSSAELVRLLGVPVRKVLHAEQRFEHLAPVHVGDEVRIQRRITDMRDKRGGELSFVVIETSFTVQDQEVCRALQTLLIRNQLAETP